MKTRVDAAAHDRPSLQSASQQEAQQGKAASGPRQLRQGQRIAQLTQTTAAPDKTGLPDALRSGIEALSGMDVSEIDPQPQLGEVHLPAHHAHAVPRGTLKTLAGTRPRARPAGASGAACGYPTPPGRSS
jgi:hypothetical protein